MLSSLNKIMLTIAKWKSLYQRWKLHTNSLQETVKLCKIYTLKKSIHFMRWEINSLSYIKAHAKY